MKRSPAVIAFVCVLLLPAWLHAQSALHVGKHLVALEIAAAHSFPRVTQQEPRWRATFYPAGIFNLRFQTQLTANWAWDAGLGIVGYALSHKGPHDTYVLDFATPQATAGLSYSKQKIPQLASFAKLSAGCQLGYQRSFTETYKHYQVQISAGSRVVPHLQPEIGLCKTTRHARKGSRFAMQYSVSTFFRFNLAGLGTATFVEADTRTVVAPNGHLIGVAGRVLLPVGRQRLQQCRTSGRSTREAPSAGE